MRRLLIISPHFPPTDVVDMHRVRASSRYYAENGWDPTVLAVRPQDCGRLSDERLIETAPPDVPVVRTGAFPEPIARRLGFSAIGFRAYFQLRAAGDRLIRELRPDLAFFSTTAFPLMALGASWQRRFGLPFVLDMQDPWYAMPGESARFRRQNLKSRVMYGIHRRLEALTMARASGLMAVSPDYIDALRTAYPRLAARPGAAIPFAFEPNDFAVARRLGRPVGFGFPPEATVGVYAGRVTDGMLGSVTCLLEAMRLGGDGPLGRLRLGFLGTGYQLQDNPEVVAPLAREVKLEAVLREQPDRVSLLDSLATLAAADMLLLLGSGDLAYQPSKLFQYLATDRPILCVAPSGAQFLRTIAGLESLFVLRSDESLAPQLPAFSRWVGSAAENRLGIEPARRSLAQRFSARVSAAKECALFDAALEQ